MYIGDKRIIITTRQFWHTEFLSTDEIFMSRSQREREKEREREREREREKGRETESEREMTQRALPRD